MNVLFILFTSAPGGATNAAVSLMRGIAARGHRVYAVTPSEGYLTEALKGSGVEIQFAPASLTVWPTYITGGPFTSMKWLLLRLMQWRKCRRMIYRYIRQYGIDIVHTNNGPVDLALSACRKAGIPHVWHLREYQDKDFNLHFFPSAHSFQRKIHKTGNYNIAITRGIFDYFSLRDNIDRVIYDGIEENESSAQMPEKENIVLFAGNITEGKCLHSLIAGFAKFHISHPNYRLQIAGRFDESSVYCRKCRQDAETLEIGGCTDWLGFRNDLQELMGKARIFCVPSRSEGFGLITVEAMSQGCILIGRNTAGTKEQMDNALEWTGGEAAIRFNDDSELPACLTFAAENNLDEMRVRAKKAASYYSVQRNVEAVEDFYTHILNEGM